MGTQLTDRLYVSQGSQPTVSVRDVVTIGQQNAVAATTTALGSVLEAAHVAAAVVPSAITDSTGGTAATTFAAITAGASYAQADMVAVKNALSQIALNLDAINSAVTVLNAIRTALVNAGLMVGP